MYERWWKDKTDEIFIVQRERNNFLHLKFISGETFEYLGLKVNIVSENIILCGQGAGVRIYLLKEVKWL